MCENCNLLKKELSATKKELSRVRALLNPIKKDKAEHWKAIIDCWFSFYKSKFGSEPDFEPAAAVALGKLMAKIKKRVLKWKAGYEWSEQNAIEMFTAFLNKAYSNEWMRNNAFLLPVINQKFDAIADGKRTTENKPAGFNAAAKADLARRMAGTSGIGG